MADIISLAIDKLASAAFIEGGVSIERTNEAREYTEQRKRELIEAIAASHPQAVEAQAAPAAVAGLDHTAMHDALLWLRSALDCKDWHWSPEQRDCAELAYHASIAALPATEDSSAGDLAEAKIADEMSREERMIVLQRDSDGTPTVWCDPEIADIVCALNSGGVKTVASCSGHGVKPGGIALADGRQILLLESLEAFNSAMSAITQAEVQAKPVTDEQIKAAFLANGFTIKEGLTDLKPYVYQAARALLQLAAPQAQPADALDAAELKEVQQAISDFEECGETAVSYELLMRAANAGYLECARFEATQGGQKALDAAMAAAQEGGKA